MPKLSIIIPIYKVEQYLPACLDSVLDPLPRDVELILVDDGSPDDSAAIAEDYARRYGSLITLIRQENRGLGGARNTGIQAARGEYLLFLDSDDSLSPGAVAEMLEALESGADVVVFDFLTVDEQGRELKYTRGAEREGSFTLAEYPALLLDPPNAWNKLWRRSLFAESGVRYPERLWYEDLATTPGLYLPAGSILAVHRPWVRYLLRAGSITNSKNLSRNAEIIQAVDLALEAYRRQGKLEAFAPALEAMAVKHQLLMATTRINAIDPHSPLQRQLKQDLEQKFPAWRENPWLSRFPAQHRLLLQLIDRGRYGAVHALMAANKILKGKKV